MHPILANAAAPVFIIIYPRLFWLLPAIIIFEQVIVKQSLGVSFKRSLLGLTIANVVSSFVGALLLTAICMSLAWTGSSHGIFDDIGFAFWLYNGRTNLWLTLTGMLMYFVLCYFISVYLEYWIVRCFLREVPSSSLRHYSWKVHIPSYAVLALLWTALNLYWILGK